MQHKTFKVADLFCGAGGSSLGVQDACAKKKIHLELLAINHWDVAIATHTKNLPNAKHLCQSIDSIDPLVAVRENLRGRLDLLWASPECTHFSQARGGKPLPDQRRSSAWKVVEWAGAWLPETILIENVKEFKTWGPLKSVRRRVTNKKTGKVVRKTLWVPIPEKRGTIYMAFLNALRAFGYNVEDRILCAADFGDATTRERLFIQCRLNKPITWPEPTHSKEPTAHMFGATLQPWRAAKEIIHWDLPSRSIFDPTRRPLAASTIKRILAGLERFGGEDLKPFLVVLRNNMGAQSIDGPLPTLTAGGNHVGVVEPGGEPFQVIMRGKSKTRSITKPLPSIGTSGAHVGVVIPQFSSNNAKPVDRPLGTITTTSRGIGLAEPFIVPQFGERKGQSPRSHSVQKPLPTVTSHGAGGLVEPFIVPNNTNNQPVSTDDPLSTVTGGNRLYLAEPFILGHRQFDEPCIDSIKRPLRTITAKGASDMGVVQAELKDDSSFILKTTHTKSNGHNVRSTNSPLSTVTTARGGEDALVTPVLSDVDATGCLVTVNHGIGSAGEGAHVRRSHSIAAPVPTLTKKNGLGLAKGLISKYYGTGQCRPVDEPLDTVTTKDRFGLVMPVINGRALDIRFRMLVPAELAGSHSFPDNYEFSGTREEVVKQIGNSNPRRLTAALCEAVMA